MLSIIIQNTNSIIQTIPSIAKFYIGKKNSIQHYKRTTKTSQYENINIFVLARLNIFEILILPLKLWENGILFGLYIINSLYHAGILKSLRFTLFDNVWLWLCTAAYIIAIYGNMSWFIYIYIKY